MHTKRGKNIYFVRKNAVFGPISSFVRQGVEICAGEMLQNGMERLLEGTCDKYHSILAEK